MNDSYRFYIRDLGFLIKERTLEAKKEYHDSFEDGKKFKADYLAAYTSIINTILNQTTSFNIDEKDISIDIFNPEKELLGLNV